MALKQKESDAALERLFTFGLAYPGAHVKSPWPGHRDLAVKDKTFAYMSLPGDPVSISCKLPHSADAALALPFTAPTAYGLGKSGWVSANVPEGTPVPVELFMQWIDESYRAQAPKSLSKTLPAFDLETAVAAAPRAAARKPSARAAPKKKAKKSARAPKKKRKR